MGRSRKRVGAALVMATILATVVGPALSRKRGRASRRKVRDLRNKISNVNAIDVVTAVYDIFVFYSDVILCNVQIFQTVDNTEEEGKRLGSRMIEITETQLVSVADVGQEVVKGGAVGLKRLGKVGGEFMHSSTVSRQVLLDGGK